MGKWQYEYEVRFYGRGLFIKSVYVRAKDKQEAISKVRESGETIIEMICCRRIDTW